MPAFEEIHISNPEMHQGGEGSLEAPLFRPEAANDPEEEVPEAAKKETPTLRVVGSPEFEEDQETQRTDALAQAETRLKEAYEPAPAETAPVPETAPRTYALGNFHFSQADAKLVEEKFGPGAALTKQEILDWKGSVDQEIDARRALPAWKKIVAFREMDHLLRTQKVLEEILMIADKR